MEKWDVDSGTRRDNHVNFFDRYVLLLEEEYTDEQAGRVCGNGRGTLGPLNGRNSKAGSN
jgi:hypothetical protein